MSGNATIIPVGMKPSAREQEWNEWLLRLNPWERHYVFATIQDGMGTKSREIDWFEDFMAGEADLALYDSLLAAVFAPES